MRGRKVVTSVIALGVSLSAQAVAQAPAPNPPAAPAPPPAAPEPAPPPPPADAEPAPAPEPAPVPAPEPAPLPPLEASPQLAPPADPELDLPPIDSYSASGDAWYDLIEFSAFVDAYASFNFNFPKPQLGKNTLRAHDHANGFSLSWVGVDASYPADPVGATVSLRFGPTAHQLSAGCLATETSCDSAVGLEYLKQGFVSWKPGGAESAITLDLGKFDTPFGVEVAESHLNLNYTRSFLYALAQPSFHTGLRANFVVADAFDFRVLAVNGWNNSIDNNIGKSLGAQGTFHLRKADGADLLSASLGYMVGPERDDVATIVCADGEAFSNSSGSCVASTAPPDTVRREGLVDRASSNTEGLRHLIDLVVVADPIERLRLVLNADFGLEKVRNERNLTVFDTASYWGVLLGARLGIVDEFAVAARGEYVSDPEGFLSGYYSRREEIALVSGTLTLEALPADFLTIRLDGRLDWSDKHIFNKDVRSLTGTQFTTTLGVVAHTN